MTTDFATVSLNGRLLIERSIVIEGRSVAHLGLRPGRTGCHHFAVEERPTVHKTIADNGGVRLRKTVHLSVVDIDEELMTDAVNVVHVPVAQDVRQDSESGAAEPLQYVIDMSTRSVPRDWSDVGLRSSRR